MTWKKGHRDVKTKLNIRKEIRKEGNKFDKNEGKEKMKCKNKIREAEENEESLKYKVKAKGRSIR
jgi:hypothetical protein